MIRRTLLIMLLFCAAVCAAVVQASIPPNYSAYTLNPLYKENPTLGWAEQRIEEKLARGMVAVPSGDGKVYLGWRLLKADPESIAFNVYRSTAGGKAVKLNAKPIRKTTDFVDTKAPLDRDNAWWVRPVLNGKEQEACGRAALAANPPQQQYLSFKLRDDIPGRGIHKIGIGDLDGDGEYDFIIKRPGGGVDPGRARLSPDTFKVEGYKRDGTFLWRRDLGWSIELGTWYSPMIVYDFDGDGKAEVAIKTGEGDHRNEDGRVLTGPEYCSVWNGETGEEIAKVDWIPRGNISDWGDTYGNRASRHMMGVAYLDGKTPSLLVIRGIYGLMKMDAWYLRDKQLHKAWSWSNQTSGWKYQGQGQHNIHVADIDGDGCDEILNGSIAIDNDGRIIWSTGLGHGDRFYITDVDPDRPGLEVLYSYEDPHPQNGLSLWDARTGNLIWGITEEISDNQMEFDFTSDIDASVPGMECWGDKFFFSAKGKNLGGKTPPRSELIWWDGDLLREMIRGGGFWSRETSIFKYKGLTLTSGIEGRVIMMADILGDWREELITYARGELRIYTTVIPAVDRRVCLMQDPIYRLDVAFRAMGYDQVPMTSYYLGVSSADSAKVTPVQKELSGLPKPH
jgi:rhamnogalacturonan endolyase